MTLFLGIKKNVWLGKSKTRNHPRTHFEKTKRALTG